MSDEDFNLLLLVIEDYAQELEAERIAREQAAQTEAAA